MDMILKNTFQSISPAYELIGDVTVGSNTTQVDFTGLNIGKDDELLLVADWINGSVTSGIGCSVNGISVTSGYKQYVAVSGSVIEGGRRNELSLEAMSAGQRGLFFVKIKLTNSGYYAFQSSGESYYGGAGNVLIDAYGSSTVTLSSITSINIATQTNCIATGSRFQLYKLVAEKVADIIVPSNTTSVDITGLNIGKDGEYYLVSDTIASADCVFYLTPNGNDTLTNYYNQLLVATGTTVAGSRTNSPIFVSNNPSEKSLGCMNIKLTNSGYYVAQNSIARGYGGSAIQVTKINTTSTATMSSITSLKAISSVANGIGANSRFTLYKMK